MNKKIVVCLISAVIIIGGGRLLYENKNVSTTNPVKNEQAVTLDNNKKTNNKSVNIEKNIENNNLKEVASENKNIKKPNINKVVKSLDNITKPSSSGFQDNEAIEIVKSFFKKDDENSKENGGHIGYEVVEKTKTDNGMYFKIRRYEIRDDRVVTLGWYSILENNKRVMDEIMGDYLN